MYAISLIWAEHVSEFKLSAFKTAPPLMSGNQNPHDMAFENSSQKWKTDKESKQI